MAKRCATLIACLASAPLASATGLSANPIRRVVNMLQKMQKSVTEEGDKAEELFEKYMCYCKTGTADLSKSITAADSKIAELGPAIKGAISKKAQLDKDLKMHAADKAAATKAMGEATSIRDKETASYNKEMSESKTNLVAIRKAVAALEKGMGGSFLQSKPAEVLRSALARDQSLMEADREQVVSFLAGEYTPQGAEVVGILKQMGDDMAKDVKEMQEGEATAAKNYDQLMFAKKREVVAITKSIEDKLNRVGDIGVELATMKNDLRDASESVVEDRAFLGGLKMNCDAKGKVHEVERTMRAKEIVALADTIKVLNDDDALDLFKKTLPSSATSFLQLQQTTDSVRADAREVVDQARAKLPADRKVHVDFISLALRGKKVGMDEVIVLVDKLVQTLKREQTDDDTKQTYCMKQLDEFDDKKKDLERKINNLGTSKAEMQEAIDTISEEIKNLKAGIKALDESVAEATKQRKAENEEYRKVMSDSGAAKEVLLVAKTRLGKFYSKAALLQQQQAVAARAADGEGEGEDENAAPPPPPETMAAYTTKTAKSGGVISMLDTLVYQLEREMTVAKSEEKESQAQYEKAMTSAADKRAMDAKVLNDKAGKKADLESSLEVNRYSAKSTGKELTGTNKYLMTLHTECDWLLQNYDARKQARADEIDSMVKAKAVLSGSDYSFLQLGRSSGHGAPKRRRFLHFA